VNLFEYRLDFVALFLVHFNEKLRQLMDVFEIDNWEDFLVEEDEKQRTSKRASFLSPMVDLCIQKAAKELKLDWKFIAGDGFDSILEGEQIEHKFSLSTGNSWTGHPYSNKVPKHLLIKTEISNNILDKLFIGVVELGDMNYRSSANGTSSFSSIKIHNDDLERCNLLYGGLQPKIKWCNVIPHCVGT